MDQITILHDSFGKRPELRKEWGFAALLEFGGRRILFDTGNNARTFAENTEALGIDLLNLDFVAISHRHGDHTSGLNHLLKLNPRVKIYTPTRRTEFSVPVFQASSIRGAIRCPLTCSTTTASRPRSFATGHRGPKPTSSGSRRRPRSQTTSGSSVWCR